MTKEQLRERTMEKIHHIVNEFISKNEVDYTAAVLEKKKNEEGSIAKKLTTAFWDYMSLYDSNWGIRVGVHFGLFRGAIEGQGSEEQKKKYLPLINSCRIFGCFAMTELGFFIFFIIFLLFFYLIYYFLFIRAWVFY